MTGNTGILAASWRIRAALVFCTAALAVSLAPAAHAAVPAAPHPHPDTALAAAIAGPQRSAKDSKRDVYRHPQQTLAFFGLRPDQTVVEIAPGGGWYTDILAPYLHDQGKLYEAQYVSDVPAEQAGQQRDFDYFAKKLAANPALYGGVTVGTLHAGQFAGVAPPGSADLVVTFRNIHNWIADGRIDDNLHAFFAVLKPGGTLGVEEHRANAGTTVQQMIDSGYVSEAYVIEHARAAGFVFAGRSEVNRNPRDTKDYPNGVWSLPPTLRGGEQDRARYLAIGESDRMTLRFTKPQQAH